MLKKDKIYGEYGEYTPLFMELITSEPLQRLKGLNQFGLPDRYHHLNGFSRFEHSMGVMLLLRYFGAKEDEQVAGLLHDVSHRAFSHIYDWVTDTAGKEDSQDNVHEIFIRKTEIPLILKRYGLSIDRITDHHNFGLLERDVPDLCADRIDYVLREIDDDFAREIFGGLREYNGQIVCADRRTAEKLGRTFLSRQIEHWGGWEGVSRYYLFSSVLKRALNLGIVQQDDFWKDDEYIVGKLETCSDEPILNTLKDLKYRPLKREADGPIVRKKFRYIDPPFLQEGNLIKLTAVDGGYRKSLEKAMQDNEKGQAVPCFVVSS